MSKKSLFVKVLVLLLLLFSVIQPVDYTMAGAATSTTNDKASYLKANINIVINDGQKNLAGSSLLGAKSAKYNWTSSNKKVATVSKGILTPVSLGQTTIKATYKDIVKGEFKVNIITHNTGADMTKAVLGGSIWNLAYGDSENVKDVIHTVPDLVAYLKLIHYRYNPQTPILATKSWTWALDGSAGLDLRFGVCCDVANVAAYVLQDDYEDLGFVLISGNGVGHIYNYVYQDETYYVFDLTQLACANSDNRDYQLNYIWTGKDIMKYADKAISYANNDNRVGLITVYSIDGHDEQPANYISNMSDTSNSANERVEIGFEDSVNAKVLYQNPDLDYNLVFFKTEDIASMIPKWGTKSILDEMNTNREATFDFRVIN